MDKPAAWPGWAKPVWRYRARIVDACVAVAVLTGAAALG
jgi:hypothetical protein